MHCLKLIATLCALVMPLTAFSATFEIPRPYVLLLLDGQPAKSNMLNSKQQVTLDAGQHQLVLQFEGSFRDQSESRLIRGEPVVFNLKAQADDQLAIQFAYPRNFQEAEHYLKQQKLQVINRHGQPASQVDYFVLPTKEGLQIGRDYQQELTDLGKAFQQTSMPTTATAVAATAAAAAVQPAGGQAGSVPVAKSEQTLEMLKYWYNQADSKTRKDFQHWVISQQ